MDRKKEAQIRWGAALLWVALGLGCASAAPDPIETTARIETAPSGGEVRWVYDEQGLVLAEEYDADLDGVPDTVAIFQYDADGVLVGVLED
jgi:hypothetical protein